MDKGYVDAGGLSYQDMFCRNCTYLYDRYVEKTQKTKFTIQTCTFGKRLTMIEEGLPNGLKESELS